MKKRLKLEAIVDLTEAGVIEDIMLSHGIKFTLSEMRSAPRKGNPKKGSGRHANITEDEMNASLICIQDNPAWNNNEIAKSMNLSPASVARIRNGTHSLYKKFPDLLNMLEGSRH
jgi:hypothetical protein